jgi:hypothetical protein
MTERWLDQFLGDPIGEPGRADVLEALRGHVMGEIVAEEENPDGTTARHVQGILVEASRDPESWDSAEKFAVVDAHAANAWHKDERRWETVLRQGGRGFLRECFEAASQPHKFTFGVPESGILEYPGTDAGHAGYRFTREDGSAVAVVLWHGVMFVTEDGDLAPGMGRFTVHVDSKD